MAHLPDLKPYNQKILAFGIQLSDKNEFLNIRTLIKGPADAGETAFWPTIPQKLGKGNYNAGLAAFVLALIYAKILQLDGRYTDGHRLTIFDDASPSPAETLLPIFDINRHETGWIKSILGLPEDIDLADRQGWIHLLFDKSRGDKDRNHYLAIKLPFPDIQIYKQAYSRAEVTRHRRFCATEVGLKSIKEAAKYLVNTKAYWEGYEVPRSILSAVDNSQPSTESRKDDENQIDSKRVRINRAMQEIKECLIDSGQSSSVFLDKNKFEFQVKNGNITTTHSIEYENADDLQKFILKHSAFEFKTLYAFERPLYSDFIPISIVNFIALCERYQILPTELLSETDNHWADIKSIEVQHLGS